MCALPISRVYNEISLNATDLQRDDDVKAVIFQFNDLYRNLYLHILKFAQTYAFSVKSKKRGMLISERNQGIKLIITIR